MNKKTNLKSYSALVNKLEADLPYRYIYLVLPDGSKSVCRSTMGEADWDTIQLDVDYKEHPAWQEKLVQVTTSSSVKGFASRYTGLNLDI